MDLKLITKSRQTAFAGGIPRTANLYQLVSEKKAVRVRLAFIALSHGFGVGMNPYDNIVVIREYIIVA